MPPLARLAGLKSEGADLVAHIMLSVGGDHCMKVSGRRISSMIDCVCGVAAYGLMACQQHTRLEFDSVELNS